METIELALQNPYGLRLTSRVLARAGLRGAGIERLAGWKDVGAVLSDPLTVRNWGGGLPSSTPAGVVWYAGGRAIRRVRQDLQRWAGRSILPVLMPFDRAEAVELLQSCEDAEPMALVLDCSELAELQRIREIIRTVRERWLPPLLVELALDAPFVELWSLLNTVDALIIARGPRAVAGSPPREGRLVGPAIEPLMHALTQQLHERGSPSLVIGAATAEGAQQALALGAAAVVLDTGLWVEPTLAEQIVGKAGSVS